MTAAPIVVAVSGEERAALAYAVTEARRTGSVLRLVHVVDSVALTGAPVAPLVSYADLEETAGQILDRAAEIIGSLTEDPVGLEKVVRRGPAAHVLITESADAALVILEHRSLSRLTRVFTGSTSTAVAARAACPVVSVPESWEPGEQQRVVVGVDDEGEPEAALRMAFEEAAGRGSVLCVVHAWQLAHAYDRAAVRGGVQEEWRRSTRPVVEQAVDRWRPKHPQVRVDVELHYETPGDALTSRSQDAALVVLGRRTRRGPLRIGSLARTMIRVAQCPVMVVPVPELRGTLEAHAEDWGLDADELSPEA